MLEVELKSNDLKEFLHLELNKTSKEPLLVSDLDKFEFIQLDGLDFLDEKTDNSVYDLVFFRNLEECFFSNMNISKKDVEILNDLKTLKCLHFYNCTFEDNCKFENSITDLFIESCENIQLKWFNQIKTLNSLTVLNCKEVSIKGISLLNNVSMLFLQHLELENIDEIQNMKKLKFLDLNGSKISNLNGFRKKNDLKVVHNKEVSLMDSF